MPVDMDIKGSGRCNIEVQLNKQDNDKFEKIKTQEKQVNLDEASHVRFDVQRARYPKRIRFVFRNIESDKPIEIKNISLRKGKYKLDDIKAFSLNDSRIATADGTLMVPPPEYLE